ncbi:MAG: class I SAM-dependent methyltransferase [Candidatus Hodarchaeales archaeon]
MLSDSKNKILNQLKLCNFTKKEIWIDAGCGDGTYTLPLASLVSYVIAIDKNHHYIDKLKKNTNLTNINFIIRDFYKEKLYHSMVDGVLFAFSLHYNKKPLIALENAVNNLKDPLGSIIIIDYTSKIPKPWVPYPITKNSAEQVLMKTGIKKIKIIFDNRRFYILKGSL